MRIVMRGKVEHRIFPSMLKSQMSPWVTCAFAVALVVGTTGCAGLFGQSATAALTVANNERVYLSVEPFDDVVTAQLQRAGIDASELQREFEAEVRYRLFARGQEEALDSVGAAVAVGLSARNWQPGFGNSGTYAVFALSMARMVASKNADLAGLPSVDSISWTWQARSRDNAPPAYAVRHMARLAADEVVGRIRPPRKPSEPPPPLHLMR
jgi:hypothetical protein